MSRRNIIKTLLRTRQNYFTLFSISIYLKITYSYCYKDIIVEKTLKYTKPGRGEFSMNTRAIMKSKKNQHHHPSAPSSVFIIFVILVFGEFHSHYVFWIYFWSYNEVILNWDYNEWVKSIAFFFLYRTHEICYFFFKVR